MKEQIDELKKERDHYKDLAWTGEAENNALKEENEKLKDKLKTLLSNST